MSFPATIDSFSNPQGTSLLSNDHALEHRNVGTAIIAIENTIGTTGGTSVLKNFTAGQFAVKDTGGTLNSGIIGTPTITGGTINNSIFGTPLITGGTYNAGIFGTPTFGTITVPGTVLPLTPSAALSPSVSGTVTDTAGGTITINAQVSNVFFSVMGTAAGNRTVGTPLNPTAWQSLTYGFKASGSANGTLVWPTGAFTFSQDVGTPAIGTGTSWSYFSWRYNPVTSRWEFFGQSKNIT